MIPGAAIKLSAGSGGGFWEVPVLFEDNHLLALDKPAGLLTSPDPESPQQPSLLKLLHAGIAESKPWALQCGLQYVMNAHRLDFETSGVILFARNKEVLLHLADLFGSEKPINSCVALVRGAPKEETFTIDAALAPHPGKPGFMRIDIKDGKRSRTSFVILERFAGYALVKCQPLTSRTHQVRVHLQRAGLPVVADPMYGGGVLFLSQLKRGYRARKGGPERPLIGRVALHAERLELPHPVGGGMLAISAPWPKDLTVAVKYLRLFASR
jgi:RluA family pseudouridine synthase